MSSRGHGQGSGSGSSSRKRQGRVTKWMKEQQAEFARASLTDESEGGNQFSASSRYSSASDTNRRRRQSRRQHSAGNQLPNAKRRRLNSRSPSTPRRSPPDTDASATDGTISAARLRRKKMERTADVESVLAGAQFSFGSSDDESDNDAGRYDLVDLPPPAYAQPLTEKYDTIEHEEAADDSGYETDEEVEDVQRTFDITDEDAELGGDQLSAAAASLPVIDLLDQVNEFRDNDVEDNDDEVDNSRLEASQNSAMQNETDPIDAAAAESSTSPQTTATWTPDMRRPPRDGERIVCPKWGHPLLRNRDEIQDEEAAKKAATFRKVAWFMAAGKMKGEKRTAKEEENLGTLRRHHLVSDDEPPELCASDDSDNDKTPSQYPINAPTPMQHENLSWKLYSSLQMRSGANPMTQSQYESMFHLYEAVTVSQMKGVREILTDYAIHHPTYENGTLEAKCSDIEEALRSKIPIFSLTRIKDLKGAALNPYKMPMFKVKCFNLDEPKEKPSLAQARLPSDIIATDLLTPGYCQMLLYPERCHTTGVLPHYYDTDHGRDAAACHRPGAYGVAADAFDEKVAQKNKTDIPRRYTNLLFCQGSTLKLSLKQGLSAKLPHTYKVGQTNPRRFNRIKQKEVICTPLGEPFIVREDLRPSEMASDCKDHYPHALKKLARSGSICWHVDLSTAEKHKVAQKLFKDNEFVRDRPGSDFVNAMMTHYNAYLCYSMIIDQKEEDAARADDDKLSSASLSPQKRPSDTKKTPVHEKSIIFIRKDQSLLRKKCKDEIIGVNIVTVMDTPEEWEKGSLRPVEKQAYPNPYTTKLYDHEHDDIPICTLPFRPFQDDCSLSADGKKTGGGLYCDYPGISQRLKTAVQSIRIAGFVTDKTETDAMLLAMAHDLVILRNQGMIMETAVGKRRIYVEIPSLSGDWVQCAKSTHSTGHASNAPCSGCSWRRGAQGTVRYCNARGMSDLNYFLSMDRCNAVLELGLNVDQFSHIGVRQNALIDIDAFYSEHIKGVNAFDIQRSKKAPLHALRIVRECTPTIVRYDPFLSCWPGPDHLLFLGLGKGGLNLILSVLSREDRKLFVRYLKDAIAEAGLTEPYGLLRKNQNLEKGFVASLSVAQVASCVLVAPIAISQFNKQMYSTLDGAPPQKRASMRDLRMVRNLFKLLRRIIALIYFAPRTVCDTKEAALRRIRKTKQLGDLVAHYMGEVEKMATNPNLNSELRERVIKFCDLPNLHRLFEVCTFWLPSVNYNVAYLAEIMFEKCHQVMKSYFNNLRNHLLGSYFAFDRLAADDTLKRLRIATSPSIEPRGSVFDYRLAEDNWHLVDCTSCFFAPGHHGMDPPLASIGDVPKDRIWQKRTSLLTSGLSFGESDEMCKAMRISRSCELVQIKDAKFGSGRQSHNVLSAGAIFSAITDSEAKATMSINTGTDRRLRLRSVPLTEALHTQDFGTHQVMVLVKELWLASMIDSHDVKRSSVFAKGIILETDGTISKEDLSIYQATDKDCFVKLDKSCKKVMAFPWTPMGVKHTKDPWIGRARINTTTTSFLKHTNFAIQDHEHGYPSRAG